MRDSTRGQVAVTLHAENPREHPQGRTHVPLCNGYVRYLWRPQEAPYRLLKALTKWFLLWRESASLGHPMLSSTQRKNKQTKAKKPPTTTKKPKYQKHPKNKTKKPPNKQNHHKPNRCSKIKHTIMASMEFGHEEAQQLHSLPRALSQETKHMRQIFLTDPLLSSSKQVLEKVYTSIHKSQRKAAAQFLMKVTAKLLLNWLSVFPLHRIISTCMSITEDASPISTVFMTNNAN